jgi:hypothetical protein
MIPAALVVLLGVAVFASSIVAYREVKSHNDYLKEIRKNDRAHPRNG